MYQQFSKISYWLCCICIIAAALWYPKWEKPRTEATLSWDVMGYYLYLPAAIIHKDLKQLAFKDEVLAKYHPTGSFYQAFIYDNGNYVMKYPIGLAILYLPFFLLAHLSAYLMSYPMDGFSLPYQAGISWGSIFIALLGLWYLRKILRLYFSEWAVVCSLITVVAASNYLNYTAIDGSMSHNWVFTFVVFLIGQTIKWYQQPNIFNSLCIGACIGLAALSRPTDILICLIPVFWGLTNLGDIKNRLLFWKQKWGYLLLIVSIVAIIGSIQLFYWKYVSGDWIVYSYQDQGFSWLHPHIKDVLISYRKGWLLYTPIMLIALIGWIPLYRNYRFLFWGGFVYFMLHFYITAAWDVWWYGGCFGQRALIQAYPILLFPFAAFIDIYLVGKPKVTNISNVDNFKNVGNSVKNHVNNRFIGYKRIAFGFFLLFCTWLNCFQTYQAHGHGFEVDAMTKAYYWRIFGKANPTELDKKLLDTKEDYQGERNNIQVIYSNDFETVPSSAIYTSQQAHSGKQSLELNAQNQFSPEIRIPVKPTSNKWIRVQAQFYVPQKEWEVWKMAQMIVRFKKEDKILQKRMIRVHRQLGERTWQANWTDMDISDKEFDEVVVLFWNANGTKTLFIDDLSVEMYEN